MKNKELLQIITQLEEINNGFQNNTIKPQEANEILVLCQEAAISVGNELELKGETGEQLMHLMEEYCECIYQLNINLEEKTDYTDVLLKISDVLQKTENGIINELPADKKEIVFLPYKASMWDSLESIWMSIKDNPEYDVYVVPIPYCDKNPDGSARQWYYEGNEYPDYVKITYWEDYNLETHRPDVVYIHNPYDSFNYVTSVHPQYYSSELKKYTNELIYVPYFVCVDDNIAEHFVTVAGVVNADKVYVQSEKIRADYIKVFIDFIKSEQQTLNEEICKRIEEIAENKFVVYESPKLDKVKRAKTAEAALPPEWEQLIRKEDGTNKKTVLYNTTINELLKNKEIYMQKICSVLQTFKSNNEVVLWWRPHPLLESTLESILPQSTEEFREIVKNYKAEGWGIYDDTPDITRAVVATDAYYGDMSSVVALYKETGKPVMIQNVELV